MNVELGLLNQLSIFSLSSNSPQVSDRLGPKNYVFKDTVIEPNSR
jgi:hypothetical protein